MYRPTVRRAQDRLAPPNSSSDDIVLRGPGGIAYSFYGPPSAVPSFTGLIRQIRTRGGQIRTFAYDSETYRLVKTSQTEDGISVEVNYTWTDVATGVHRIASATLGIDAGEEVPVTSATYSYYDGTTEQGNLGDLQRVTRKLGSASTGVTTSESYYTYYLAGQSNFSELKYTLERESFQRLLAVCPDPTDANDGQLAAYADCYFEYDSRGRVTLESTSGGQYTHAFEYFARGNSSSPNTWQKKTIETLPDGNRNIVYCNGGGQTMLFVWDFRF